MDDEIYWNEISADNVVLTTILRAFLANTILNMPNGPAMLQGLKNQVREILGESEVPEGSDPIKIRQFALMRLEKFFQPLETLSEKYSQTNQSYGNLMIKNGKCPYCKNPIHKILMEEIQVTTAAGDIGYNAISYVCPNSQCHAVLSVQLDPFALSADS